MSGSDLIETIKRKMGLLIADNRKLRTESSKVSAQRDRLREQNSQMTERVEQFSERVRVLELSLGMAGDKEEREQAKARVNRLIKEIDSCIDLLQ